MTLQILTCPCCEGAGRLDCSHCCGIGTRYPELPRGPICPQCRGKGSAECEECDGAGEIQEASGEIEGEE